MIKKLVLSALICLTGAGFVFADDSQAESGSSVYTLFVNIVDEGFRFPLLGFVNIATGNHDLPQIGFVNFNQKDFGSLQASFVNIVGGGFSGAQLGFVNTVGKKGEGLQLGFVNTSAQKFSGTQVGFVNYADSIDDGIPVGFISIVRHGGYKAVEYSFSEFHPVSLGLKLGVERFYTNIIAAYNPFVDSVAGQFAFGLGVGSIIPVKGAFFYNQELNYLSASLKDGDPQFLSFVPYFGYGLSPGFKIVAGPSVTWAHSGNNNGLQKPLFSLYDHHIDSRNSIVIGARVGARFLF